MILLVWISVRLIYIIELVKLVRFCLMLIRLINQVIRLLILISNFVKIIMDIYIYTYIFK